VSIISHHREDSQLTIDQSAEKATETMTLINKHYRSINIRAISIILISYLVMSCGAKQEDTRTNVDSSAIIESLKTHGLERNNHYKILSKGVAHSEDKVIVSEYFWYGCSHCFSLDPIIKQWKRSLPSDAEILPIPVVWQPMMTLHAKAYYIGEQLLAEDLLSKRKRQNLHESLFPVIMNLRSETREKNQLASIRAHFSKFGITNEKFDELAESQLIKDKVAQAKRWQKMSGIEGTPVVIVDGIYKLNHGEFETKENLIVYGNQVVNAVLDAKKKPEEAQ